MQVVLQAASRRALAEARERLDSYLDGASEADAQRLGDELFAAVDLLGAHVVLRRHLADPATDTQARVRLLRSVLGGKLSEPTMDTLDGLVASRWSRPRDLVDAAETLGQLALLTVAQKQGVVEDVEDELFRFGRIVGGDAELSRILSDRTAPAAGKAALLDRLVGSRVSPITAMLLRNHLTGRTVGNAENVVERLSEAASHRRGQSVARVTTAVPLTATQERRLSELLGRLYHRPIGLQVTVDPSVLGGLVIRVGDEVIDGSIAHRLESAGRRLVG